VPLSDQPFRVPRFILGRLAAEQYIRSFWWFVAIPPAFGVVCLFSGSQVLYAIGTFGILWPATVPARAVVITRKSARFFSQPTRLHISDKTVYFSHDAGDGMKLSLASVRKIEERHGYILLIYGIGEFVAIPADFAPPLAELFELAEAARQPVRQD
jgi:hypothetical protein